MKSMSRIWMALVVGVTVMAVVVPSWAIPLSNTPLTWDQFTSLVDTTPNGVVGIPLVDQFVFENGPQGEIMSGVFKGKSGSNAEGLYAYIYQVKVYSTPDGKIDEVSIPFAPTALPPSTVNLISSFYISSGVPGGFFYGQGDKAPTKSAFASSVVSFSWIDNEIFAGESSYIFGFFHSAPPIQLRANLSDSGAETKFPLVWTPSPEPSVFLLFGIGLTGSAVLSRVRRRMKKA